MQGADAVTKVDPGFVFGVYRFVWRNIKLYEGFKTVELNDQS